MKAIIASIVWGVFSVVVLFAVTSEAQVNVGVPAYGGTGCPAGTAHIAYIEDSGEIQMVFDDFLAQSGRSVGKRMDRKSCNIVIPVQAQAGYQFALVSSGQGYAAVKKGAKGLLAQEVFYAGTTGPVYKRTFTGPHNDNFETSDDMIPTELVWSPCGASVNLRANMSLLTQGEAILNMDQVFLKVLQIRRCQ